MTGQVLTSGSEMIKLKEFISSGKDIIKFSILTAYDAEIPLNPPLQRGKIDFHFPPSAIISSLCKGRLGGISGNKIIMSVTEKLQVRLTDFPRLRSGQAAKHSQ